MDFRDFTYIQAIYQHETISNAAKALFISQPSLSKFLQQIEHRLGTPLFERVNKKMKPTYAGEQFLATGKEIFILENRLNDTLKQINNHQIGRLNLATTTTRGKYILPQVLPAFRQAYPYYQIDIVDKSFAYAEQAVLEGSANLAIYSLPELNPEFTNYIIRTEEIIVCLPENTPYAKYAIKKPGFKYPWLDLRYLENEHLYLDDPAQWRIGKLALELLSQEGMAPKMTLLSSLETTLSLAAQGLGFAFTFDIGMQYFKNQQSNPAYFSCGKIPYTSNFVIATRKNYVLQEADHYFINLVQQHFGEETPSKRD